MSQVPASGRSFAKIEMDDLQRLLEIEQADRADRFHRKPQWKELYSDRLLCVALCQGAAQHYVEGTVGINDFDLWTFYAEHPEKAFPPRWRLPHDFGDTKFGQSVDSLNYVGRRVDCLSRSIDADVDEDPARALQRYLKGGLTSSAKYLRTRSVVLLEPVARMGEIIWKV